MLKRLAFVLLLTSPALAQQAQQTPAEQALAEKLIQEMQISVSTRAQCIDLQRQLEAAKTRLDLLEPKKPETK